MEAHSITDTPYVPNREVSMLMRPLAAFGALAVMVGLFVAPADVWPNLLLAGTYLTGIGLGAMFFLAIHFVTKAGWSVVLRRVAEAISVLVPVGSVLLLASVLLGHDTIYAHVTRDSALFSPFKKAWLDRYFFAARSVVYVVTWIAFRYAMLRDDGLRGRRWHQRNVRLGAAFLVFFGFTVWLSSFDWIMSIEPRWYSTMFGVYNFAGLVTAAFATMIIVAVSLRRRGVLRAFNEEHLHDIGKLLWAFSIFWMYIWFSQFMLIWYSNISEEASYFVPRMKGSWGVLFYTNILLNWVVPFFVLMSRKAKRSETVLLRVSAVILVGHWLDLYQSIFPPLVPQTVDVTGWDGAIAIGMAALGIVAVQRALGSKKLLDRRDPLLGESLAYHQ